MAVIKRQMQHGMFRLPLYVGRAKIRSSSNAANSRFKAQSLPLRFVVLTKPNEQIGQRATSLHVYNRET